MRVLDFVQPGGRLPRPAPSAAARDSGPGKVFSGTDWKVSATPTEHVQPWLDSLAYRVDSAEGSVIFTGDSQPCDSVTEFARGADMMLCMCWDDQAVLDASEEYSGRYRTTGPARMAQDAGVRTLGLVHVGPRLSAHGTMEQGIGKLVGSTTASLYFRRSSCVFRCRIGRSRPPRVIPQAKRKGRHDACLGPTHPPVNGRP